MPQWSVVKRAASPMSRQHAPRWTLCGKRTDSYRKKPYLSADSPPACQPQFQLHRLYRRVQVCWWPPRPTGCECDNVDSSSSAKLGSCSSNQISVNFLKGTGRIVYTHTQMWHDASIMTNLILTCSSLTSMTDTVIKIAQFHQKLQHELKCMAWIVTKSGEGWGRVR